MPLPCFITGLQLDADPMLRRRARAAALPPAAGPWRGSSRGSHAATPCGLLQSQWTQSPCSEPDGHAAASLRHRTTHDSAEPPARRAGRTRLSTRARPSHRLRGCAAARRRHQCERSEEEGRGQVGSFPVPRWPLLMRAWSPPRAAPASLVLAAGCSLHAPGPAAPRRLRDRRIWEKRRWIRGVEGGARRGVSSRTGVARRGGDVSWTGSGHMREPAWTNSRAGCSENGLSCHISIECFGD